MHRDVHIIGLPRAMWSVRYPSPYNTVTCLLHHCIALKDCAELKCHKLFQQGSYLFTTYRPVEQLRQLLLHSQGYDSEAVQAFFKLHRVRISVNYSDLNLL